LQRYIYIYIYMYIGKSPCGVSCWVWVHIYSIWSYLVHFTRTHITPHTLKCTDDVIIWIQDYKMAVAYSPLDSTAHEPAAHIAHSAYQIKWSLVHVFRSICMAVRRNLIAECAYVGLCVCVCVWSRLALPLWLSSLMSPTNARRRSTVCTCILCIQTIINQFTSFGESKTRCLYRCVVTLQARASLVFPCAAGTVTAMHRVWARQTVDCDVARSPAQWRRLARATGDDVVFRLRCRFQMIVQSTGEIWSDRLIESITTNTFVWHQIEQWKFNFRSVTLWWLTDWMTDWRELSWRLFTRRMC